MIDTCLFFLTGILRKDLELGFPDNAVTLHFGFYYNGSASNVLAMGRVYSTSM